MSKQRIIGRTATSIRKEAGVTAVRYHSTDVVKFTNTSITLNSDGWRTVTTKRRMNETASQFGLGYSVFQKAHHWYVRLGEQVLDFEDGMTFARNH